jgi:hypothetical protein
MSVTTAGPYVAGSIVRVATWWLNQQGVLQDGFRDANGNPADPTTITLKWWTPDGQSHSANFPTAPVVRSPTTQGVSLGLFQADLDTTLLPGKWDYQWMAPDGDPVQSIAVGTFYVSPARG